MLDRERGESDSDRRRFDFKRLIPGPLRAQDRNVGHVQFIFGLVDFSAFLFSNQHDLH